MTILWLFIVDNISFYEVYLLYLYSEIKTYSYVKLSMLVNACTDGLDAVSGFAECHFSTDCTITED